MLFLRASSLPTSLPRHLTASGALLQMEYKKQLAANLGQDQSARILAFKQKAPAPAEGFDNPMASLYTANSGPRTKKPIRNMPQQPDRILDAPDLVDDYYLNLLDWGSNNAVSGWGEGARIWVATVALAPGPCLAACVKAPCLPPSALLQPPKQRMVPSSAYANVRWLTGNSGACRWLWP